MKFIPPNNADSLVTAPNLYRRKIMNKANDLGEAYDLGKHFREKHVHLQFEMNENN